MSEGKQKTGRFMALEGIRGVAAMVVVVDHFIYMFWAAAFAGKGLQHTRFEDNLHGSPLFVLISGFFAVSLFFILSGFVLSIGFFKKGSEASIKGQLARRYLRLMIPAAAICLLAWLVISLGLSHNLEVSKITHSAWLGRQWNLTPDFLESLYNGMIGIFVSSKHIYTKYDPVLWTMHWEFFGSLLIFGFLLLVGKQSKRWIAYILLALFLYKTHFIGFLLGMALADLYANGYLRDLKLKVALPVLAAALYLGGISTLNSKYYSFLPKIFSDMTTGEYIWLLRAVAATLVIFVVLMTPKISRLLEKKYISVLGKYTFALYLVHMLVLYSLTGWVFMYLEGMMTYNQAAVLTFVVSLPVIVGATVLFERYVDQPSIAVARRFGDWFLSDQKVIIPEFVREKRYVLAAKLYEIEARYKPQLPDTQPDPAD